MHAMIRPRMFVPRIHRLLIADASVDAVCLYQLTLIVFIPPSTPSDRRDFGRSKPQG